MQSIFEIHTDLTYSRVCAHERNETISRLVSAPKPPIYSFLSSFVSVFYFSHFVYIWLVVRFHFVFCVLLVCSFVLALLCVFVPSILFVMSCRLPSFLYGCLHFFVGSFSYVLPCCVCFFSLCVVSLLFSLSVSLSLSLSPFLFLYPYDCNICNCICIYMHI